MEKESVSSYWLVDSIKDVPVEDNYWFLAETGSNMVCFYRQHFYRTFHCMEKFTERIFYIKIIIKINLDERKKLSIKNFLVLEHPNLVSTKEVYETDEVIYFVMNPHLCTITDNFIEQKEITERDVAKAIRHTLKGLLYLHNKNIFHRYINPENIVVTMENGEISIKLDNCFMGTVACEEVQNTLTSSNMAFTAPELMQSTQVNLASDIWSVGLVTYYLLSGIVPFYDHTYKGRLLKIFKGELDWNEIPNLNYTIQDFISRLVVLDPAKRMTAWEALGHPWVAGDLNSLKPMPGLSEKLAHNKKLMMIQLKVDLVNGSTYDSLMKKHKENLYNPSFPTVSCVPLVPKHSSARTVIVTAESDFYFRFGPNASREENDYTLNASDVCRVLREMYKRPQVTLYEEAVRCQLHYKSVFSNSQYIPEINKLNNFHTVEAYEEWRKEIILKKIFEMQIAMEAKEKKIMEEISGEEEEENEEKEEEEENDEEEFEESLNLLKTSSESENDEDVVSPPIVAKETKESNYEKSLEKGSKYNDFIDKAYTSTFKSVSYVEKNEDEENTKNENELKLELYKEQLQMENFTIESLIEEKTSSYYEPNSQLIYELMVTKPKKKYQKRESVYDFMLMVDKPGYFEPFYNESNNNRDQEISQLIETTKEIYLLYKYRPPFHPTQLGIDQFTVDQQGFDGDFLSFEPTDPRHVGDQNYMFCREGMSIKRENPPWMQDLDNPVPLLIPISEFNSYSKKGIPVPDNCIQTPPVALPVQHLTIYDLIEDPMWSRFNPFQHSNFKNSSPPVLQSTNQMTPYPENVNYYRNLYCEESETKTLKVCNFKQMRDQVLLAKKNSVENESDEDIGELKNGPKEIKDSIDSCDLAQKKSGKKDVGITTDEAESCIHLSGRPCRLEMFDTEGKVCVLSTDGNKKLCCQNLYSTWKKIEKDHEKLRLHQQRMKGETEKKLTKKKEVLLASPDITISMPREVRNRDKVNLYVPITENPDRLTFYMDHAKKVHGKTIELALDSELDSLKELKKLQMQQENCLDIQFVHFDFDANAGHNIKIWNEDVIM